MIPAHLNFKKYIFYTNRIIINFFFLILRKLEEKTFNKYSQRFLNYYPVFIIGAPRTGSTILYQVITNQLDVVYIDNLAAKLYKNLFFGFWLSNKIYNQKPHNSFKSKFGKTDYLGMRAPNECGRFWYRWLPRNKHFIDYKDFNSTTIIEIRKEINTIINYFKKNLVFKNLNAGQRLRLLKECFPNAKFIHIKRNPLYTAQSILIAKRELGLNDNDFWSVMPQNVDKLKKLNGYEQVVKQIYYIDKQIHNDIKLFSRRQILTIFYDDICSNYTQEINKIKNFLSVEFKENFDKPNIFSKDIAILKAEELNKIQNEIDNLDWVNYCD